MGIDILVVVLLLLVFPVFNTISGVISVFLVFNTATGVISVLPLALILLVTAINDGIEDYRIRILDDEVNTLAAIKLG